MLITLLNDGTLISIGYDRVKASPYPEKWDLPVLFVVSIVLGTVSCGSSLLLLWGCLDSWNPHGWFAAFGIGGVSYRHVTTLIYLKVSISDFLTLFSARCIGPFWEIGPSPVLLGAGAFSLALSTTLAIAWPAATLDSIYLEGLGRHANQLLFLWVWLYCILCWLVQDFCKVICFKILYKYNIWGIREAQMGPKEPKADAEAGDARDKREGEKNDVDLEKGEKRAEKDGEKRAEKDMEKRTEKDVDKELVSSSPKRQISDCNRHLDHSKHKSFRSSRVNLEPEDDD